VSAAALITAEPSPSMWRAMSLSLPIVLALILLPVIAFAIPVDPSWIAGIYDDADGDDVVSLVSQTSAANTAPPLHLGPFPYLLKVSLEDIGRTVSDRYVTRGPRSPPVRCSCVQSCLQFLASSFQDGPFRQPSTNHEFPLSPPEDLPVLSVSEARSTYG